MGAAIKGVIQAEIANWVQAGIVNLLNRVERKADAQRLWQELEEILSKRIVSLPDAVKDTVMGQMVGIVCCLRDCCNKDIRINRNRDRARALYYNLLNGCVQEKDVPDVKRMVLATDPWLEVAYDHFYLNEKDDANRIELDTVARFFGVSLDNAKGRLLGQRIPHPDLDSEETVLQYRKDLQEFAAAINYVPREELRLIDAKINEYARKRANEKAKIKAKENQRRIQREIAERKAEEASRRAFGVVYPTVVEAKAALTSNELFFKAVPQAISSNMNKNDVGIVLAANVEGDDVDKLRRNFYFPENAMVLAFIDTTFWGTRKKGLVITRYGLHWKNEKDDTSLRSLSWYKWRNIGATPWVGRTKETQEHVYFSNVDYFDLGSCCCVSAERLANALAAVYSYMCEAQFAF